MDNITHVFFDLDHTLWDFDANSKETLGELFEFYDFTDRGLNFKFFIDEYIRINELYWEKYRKNEITREVLRVGRFVDAFESIGCPISEEFATKFAEKYLATCPYKTGLFPNAIEVLAHLKKSYHLSIITNGFVEVQHIKLGESKLATYFDQVICADEIGIKKPNPGIYEYALNKAGVLPENSVMIGDCIESDVKGAIRFGMSAIFFNSNEKYVDYEGLQIKDLSELKEWL